MKKCTYAKNWNCTADAKADGFCLPHALLFLWLLTGPGTEIERLPLHDAIAGLSPDELMSKLGKPPYARRTP